MKINDSIFKRFARLIRTGRLAHAYLFAGPRGIGKSETALRIAKRINCELKCDDQEEEPCGQCPPCRKIDSGNHPDVFVLDTGDEQSIKIARVRELIYRIQLKAFEAEKKIFIIKDAEKLTLEGSNALLKTLEEPAGSSLLLLTTSRPEKNLSTIKSRCHAVNFFPVSKESLEGQLKKDCAVVDQGQAHFLAYFSEGCLGRAKRLKEEEFFVRKNEIIDNIVFQGNNDLYIKDVLEDKERIKEVLDVLLCWFRDLILLKSGVPQDRLVHGDRVGELLELESRYSFQQVKDIIAGAVNTLRLLGENLNVKIPLTLLKEKIWIRPYRSN